MPVIEASLPPAPAPRPRGRALLWVVVGIVLIGAVFFRAAVRDNIWPKNFGVVDEGRLYRSGQLTPAAMRSVVEQHRIKTVIDLGSAVRDDGLDPEVERMNQRTADALGLTRYRFELIGDGTGNPNAYLQALRIATDPSKQPVLIHCGAGSERTGGAIVLYRAVVDGASIDAAYEEAKSFKHNPRRNPHLREVIDRYATAIIRAFREGGQVAGAEPLPEPLPMPRAEPGR